MPKPDIAFIIDDDKVFTYVLSKQMKQMEFSKSTLIFRNGAEALDHLRAVHDMPGSLPSVIFLDLNMPVLDGWQFLDEFTRLGIGKKIRIYIMSSSIDQADHEKASGYPEVLGFYVKPISKANLAGIQKEING